MAGLCYRLSLLRVVALRASVCQEEAPDSREAGAVACAALSSSNGTQQSAFLCLLPAFLKCLKRLSGVLRKRSKMPLWPTGLECLFPGCAKERREVSSEAGWGEGGSSLPWKVLLNLSSSIAFISSFNVAKHLH